MDTLTIAAVVIGVIVLLALVGRLVDSKDFIDVKLYDALADESFTYLVFSRTFPEYRFVDLQQATASLAAERGGVHIASQHRDALVSIMNRSFMASDARKIKPPAQLSRQIGHDKTAFFPADGFWVVRHDDTPMVLRLTLEEYTQRAVLEVAAKTEAKATAIIDRIVARANQDSIYRNHTIELSFAGANLVRDETGELAQANVEILFHAPAEINRDELVLPEATRAVIERNIVSFHERRTALLAAGVPAKKGVLLYGPPGTGKTFTCKYLAHRLGITTIIVAGNSLLHVKSICNIARMLQPAFVILEDVDLVFSHRTTTPFSTSLGDLMDELDGFGSTDKLTFVLTTNDIDRVEGAIKDRPGRISQCIEFENPTGPLREHYLRRLIAGYQFDGLDLGAIVRRTEGASQAFLKELVYRAAHFSLERTNTQPKSARDVELTDADFDGALQEMTSGGGVAGRSIVGFGKR